MSRNELKIGIMGESATVVTAKNTAKTVGSGSLDVFATPMLVALMERAACVALENCLPGGATTVGFAIDVKHLAASKLGNTVNAIATITATEGRKIELEITAKDGETTVGTAKHTRYIVDIERFLGSLK